MAKQIAEMRQGRGGRPTISNQVRGQAIWETELRGVVAEMSVALRLGLPWYAYQDTPPSNKTHHHTDAGPCEVKSVRSPEHKLICSVGADMYVPHLLIYVKGKTAEWLGWCFGFECHWDESLHVPTFSRASRDLYGLRSLLNWLKSYDLNVEQVDSPRFAKGWEPSDE